MEAIACNRKLNATYGSHFAIAIQKDEYIHCVNSMSGNFSFLYFGKLYALCTSHLKLMPFKLS